MARLDLSHIAHSYAEKPRGPADYALKEIDLRFEDGGAYALLGPSGCGKTTLLNILSGLITPSEGRVLFGEQDVTLWPTEARNIAQVFQFPVIYDTMTVFDNLAFPLRNRGLDAAEVRRRVDETMAMLGLEGQARRKARGLTAEEKQKISLGRGLVRADVNAILFDEPLTVIDPHMKWQLRSQLKHLHRRYAFTMIYVTHDQTEALTFADRVVVMHAGEVVQVGTPRELFDRPRHTFVGYFIGSPGMNVLPCTLSGAKAYVDGHEVPLDHDYGAIEGRIELGIRPEFVRLASGGIPIQVRSVDDVGRHRILRGSLREHAISALVPEGVAIPAEPQVRLDPAYLNVYRDALLVERKA